MNRGYRGSCLGFSGLRRATAVGVVMLGLVGCSQGDADRRAIGIGRPATSPDITRATTSANPTALEPSALTIRPIPDVIARPRPFRVPETLGKRPTSVFSDASASPDSIAVDTAPAPKPMPETPPPAGREPRRHRGDDAAAVAAADPPQPLPPAVGEIRGMLRDYLRAFNRHDTTALAAHWSPTAENVDLDSGVVTTGRDAVRDVFASLFDEDASAAIDIDVTSIRPLRDDVAVVDGVSLLSFANDPQAASRFTAVVVKHDGRWQLESVRESAQPVPQAAAGRPLEELGWLVGSWEDIGAGVTASTQCFWGPGKAFLVRNHVVAADRVPSEPPAAGDDLVPGLLPPGPVAAREVTEIVGWDPDRKTIRSWLFTSEGRFAECTWTRTPDGWSIHVEGRGRDEGCDCVCELLRKGASGLTLRCNAEDLLAAVLPPACEFERTAGSND